MRPSVSACTGANILCVPLFRNSPQPPGVTHCMFRCGHVWADFESLSCSGHGITPFAKTVIFSEKIRSGRI